MSKSGGLHVLEYQRARRKNILAGTAACRNTTQTGIPFTDIDTALQNAGFKKS